MIAKSKELGTHQRTVEKTCLVCSIQFQVHPSHGDQITCSRSCGTKWLYSPKNSKREENIQKARDAGKKSAAVQAATRRSKNEIAFASLCKAQFENVLTNEPMFNGWDADVILQDQKVAVLWNGVWHYKEIMEGTSLKQIQNRDKIKLLEIERAGYSAYIIKDMGKYSSKFVRKKFKEFLQHINQFCQFYPKENHEH